MSKRIQTYEQLMEEKKRLETLIDAQKELIRYDFKDLKHELRPVGVVFSFLKSITSRSGKYGVLNYGVDMIVDLIFKKMILSKAGWITRLTVPFLVKNFSSNKLAENKNSFLKKLRSWLGNRNGKHDKYRTSEGSKQY
jgi:hypothetical protein